MWNLINYEVGIAQFTGPILESTGINAIFQKKEQKNVKKGWNIWKFAQKYTQF